jgi:hypothetical protein
VGDSSGLVSGATSGAAAGSVAGPWGAAIGAVVGGVAGVFGQKKQEQARKKQIAKLMAMHDQLQAERRRTSAEARQQLQLGLRDVRGGFDKAAGLTRDAFRSTQIDAQDQRQQVMAQIESDLISSGRWSTDALQWARMGVGAQSSRVMAEISARSSDALAQIEQRKGIATQQARAALAQQSQMDFRNISDLEMSRMEVLGADVPGSTNYAEPIGALFGALGALWPSGGGGTRPTFDTSGLPYAPSSGGPSLGGPSGPPTVTQGAVTGSPMAPVASALTPRNPWQAGILAAKHAASGWGAVNTNAWKSALAGGK